MDVREASPGTTHHVPRPEPKRAAVAAGSGPRCRRGEALRARDPRECGAVAAREARPATAPGAARARGHRRSRGTPCHESRRREGGRAGEEAAGPREARRSAGKRADGEALTSRGAGRGALPTLPSPPPDATGTGAEAGPDPRGCGRRGGGSGPQP